MRYRATLVEYGRKAGSWSGLGVAGLLVFACLGRSVPAAIHVVFAAVVLGMIALHTVGLVRRLSRPRLYALSVATSGAPHAALVSRDKELVYDLTRRVVDAIDNPEAEYAIKVDHIENVFGDKIGGDRVDGDKVAGGKVTTDDPW